jgi:hypothetical protein
MTRKGWPRSGFAAAGERRFAACRLSIAGVAWLQAPKPRHPASIKTSAWFCVEGLRVHFSTPRFGLGNRLLHIRNHTDKAIALGGKFEKISKFLGLRLGTDRKLYSPESL